MSVGIEIMIKLNIAEKEVNALMEEAIKQVKNSMKNALDMSVLVPSTARGIVPFLFLVVVWLIGCPFYIKNIFFKIELQVDKFKSCYNALKSTSISEHI